MDPGEVTAPCGSLTVHQREGGGGGGLLSHRPASAEAGPGRWTRANAGTKTSVTSSQFYGRSVIFILCAVGIKVMN